MAADDGPVGSGRIARCGALLAIVGLAMLAVSAFVSAWPDMEASVFDPATPLMADQYLPGLHCPLVITVDEAASVRARFVNPSDRDVSFRVRARISQGGVTLVREDAQQVNLRQGEASEIAWPIASKDAAYGRLVLARVLAMRGSGLPARQAACGILVVGLRGISGDAAFALGLGIALLFILSGGALWARDRRPLGERDRSRAATFAVLACVLTASLTVGILGQWAFSHALLILFAILLVALVERLSGAS